MAQSLGLRTPRRLLPTAISARSARHGKTEENKDEAIPPGRLRRLRRLALTVETPSVIASPRDTYSPSLRARATRVPRHCEPERSEGEAIQKRRGHNVRLPTLTCCAFRLDCFGGFAASQ